MIQRIIHLAASYPPRLGGLEVVAQQLARHSAQAQAAPVQVLTTRLGAAGLPHRADEAGVCVRRCAAIEVAHTPLSLGLIWRLFRAPRGAIVHVHVAQALLLEIAVVVGLLRGSRVVAQLHLDVAASGPVGVLLPTYKKWLLAPALRRCDAVLVLNAELEELVTQTYGVAAEKTHRVANGVAGEFFAVGAAREGVLDTGQPLAALFVGRLEHQKNVARLLAALRLVDGVQLRIVGDGVERADLEAVAAQHHLPVHFAGAKYDEELRRELGQADVLVLPSDREGMPLIVLEAMAAGLPVLATDVSGTRELLGSAGLLVPATAEGLAEGLERLRADSALRAELSSQGRARAVHHQWPRITEQVLTIYRELGAA